MLLRKETVPWLRHRWGPAAIPDKYMWYTKWQWNRSVSNYFRFPFSHSTNVPYAFLNLSRTVHYLSTLQPCCMTHLKNTHVEISRRINGDISKEYFNQRDNYGVAHRFPPHLCITSSETFQNLSQQIFIIKDTIKFKMCSAFLLIILYYSTVSLCDINTLFSRQYCLSNKHILMYMNLLTYIMHWHWIQQVGFFLWRKKWRTSSDLWQFVYTEGN
jgi:hypothetical protein